MPTHTDKRCLWQVAEILGWPQNDLERVRKIYLQPAILIPFVDFFYHWRLKNGLKRGNKAKTVVTSALQVLQGDTNKWLAAIEGKANPPIGESEVYLTVITVQACCQPDGPWERRNGGECDLAAMVNNAVQVVRVLNKQVERQPYPALPRDMYKEAEKLGLRLDIDLKSPNRCIIKPKLRKRLGRKSNVSQSTGTMSNASDEKSIQAPEITDMKLIQASDDTGVNSVYKPDDTSTKPGHALPYFQLPRQPAQHHIDLIIRKCPPSIFLMLDS